MSSVRRVLIAPVSFGLGDLVVSLPVVQQLVRQASSSATATWLVARSESQIALADRIAGLAAAVLEGTVSTGPHDTFIDLRDHPLQRDHWWGTPEFTAAYGPLSINVILARIAADHGVMADFAAPTPLLSASRPDADGLTLLVADTDGTAKRWALDRWVELADALALEGRPVAVVTRDGSPHPLVDRGIDRLVAPTVGEAVDVLSACRAVVGIDTGLTHIAAQQGTPTVTLSRTPAVYFRDWDHTRLVAGWTCDPACQAAERDYAYHERVDLTGESPTPRPCPSGSRCLEAVEPDAVLKALMEIG